MNFLQIPSDWRLFPKVLLIHGFETHVRFLGIRPEREDAGFVACGDLIDVGRARVFNWGLAEDAAWYQVLNPFYAQRVYKFEQTMTMGPSVHQILEDVIREFEPEIILCHSMGAALFFNFLLEHRLHATIRKVVFIQADIPTRLLAFDHGLRQRVIEEGVPIVNVFCPWDPSLWVSSYWHESVRAGLVGLDFPQAVNILYPLWRLPNLHKSSLKSRWLRDIVLS